MDRSKAEGEIRHCGADLLTQNEVIRALRLDGLEVRNPKESLRHLRRTGQLGYVKVAGKVLIPRAAVMEYLERRTVRACE